MLQMAFHPLPKVSVIMAVKDGSKYLRQAIDSVLNQTYSDYEFIIIDDDSKDETKNIIQNYLDPRLRPIQNRRHLGLTASLNQGLILAQGEYIARMDADDISLPERLETQVHYLDCHPEIAVLGTGIRLIDKDGNPIEEVIFPSDHELIRWNLCFYNPIAHSSVMMRKQIIQQVGGYNPKYIRSQDYELWWRVSLEYQLANLDNIYLQLRQHNEQVMNLDRIGQVVAGLTIKQEYLTKILGRRVPKEIVKKLYLERFSKSLEAKQKGELIFDLLHAFGKIVNRNHLRTITEDAIRRILFAIHPYIFDVRCWPLLMRSFFLQPKVAFKFLGYFAIKRSKTFRIGKS